MKCLPILMVVSVLLAGCDSMNSDAYSVETQTAVANARNLRKSGQLEDAITLLRKQPENELTLTQLGYALIDAGRSEEAVNVFDKLLAMQPNSADAHNGKAVAFDKAGNHLVAQGIYRKALSLSPEALNINNNLALSLILNDQVDTAITMLESLNTKHPDDETIRQNLALAYGLKGEKKKALDLNLKSMTPEEAKENLRFYERYAKDRKKIKTSKATPAKQLNEIAPAAGTSNTKETSEKEESSGSVFNFSGWGISTDSDKAFPSK